MFKRFVKPRGAEVTIVELKDISAEGRVRLLDMAYSRLRFGFVMMPLITAIFAWYYHFENHPESDSRVTIWTALYFIGFGLSTLLNNAYQHDKKKLPAQARFEKWLPKIHATAIIHGFAIVVLLILVKDTASFEYKLLYIAVLTAIVSGNATHQSPVLSVFRRFLAASWHLSVVLLPWTVSSHWQFIMPLAVMFSVGMYRYSLTSHRFFVRMAWLEEEGARLAASYKVAKESAESALQDKNQFLATASHDLRQPVHAMGFLIESIAHRNKDASLNTALKDLKQSVRSVTQMFSSLLDLSKMESGAVQLNIEAISLNTLMSDIAMLFAEEAKSRNLALRIKLARSDDAVVMADAMLLTQSLINLMHNALRYTKTGGVLISARRRGDHWQLEVWDTGVGIATEVQNQVYSPFFRAEHAWQIDSAGHGLGLSVVARCCKLMGAKHGLSSRLGHGSRFWLRLPAATGNILSAKNAESRFYSDAVPKQNFLTGTCLIVDDDPQVINAWHSLLSSWGVDARCAESATQAFTALDEGFMPQAILCDQRLRAGESGFDVLRALLTRCPEASGAMISGEFDSPELLEAESEGYLVLHKPLEPEALFTLLSCWLVRPGNQAQPVTQK
jgi:signal transduction histidine kinase/CheY-like chemotaxis protein